MCGRYVLRRIDLRRFGVSDALLPGFEEFTEKVSQRGLFNIAPSQRMPIVRLDREGHRVASLVKWGLIPSWTKGKPKQQPINARAETVATSPMFRQAIERRRCLVPADGFYEWQGAKPPKQPFFIHMRDDASFAFAGLWERWQESDDAEPIETFTIITTSPNELMASIHNRMPVILDQSDYERWLDRDEKAVEVLDLLKPFPADRMEAWPVSSKVNTPRNDDPSLIERAGVE